MELVDSHCHLHNAEYFPGLPEDYLGRAHRAGVNDIVVIGTSCADSVAAKAFATQFNSAPTPAPRLYWTFGVHPSEFEKPFAEPDFSAARPIAIGEVGLDYHYGPEDYGGLPLNAEEIKSRQWRLLEQMIELGQKYQLPFSFHVREAFPDFFAILNNFPTLRGVIHSFTDNKQNLRRCLDYGFYIGVNGLATYSTLPQPPLERILLETDAPFLAPIPHRGERNEPAYISDVAAWLAATYKLTPAEVAQATTDNFKKLFQPPHIDKNH